MQNIAHYQNNLRRIYAGPAQFAGYPVWSSWLGNCNQNDERRTPVILWPGRCRLTSG
jgi:hypothetical protein